MIYLSGKHDERFMGRANTGLMATPRIGWANERFKGFVWAADTGCFADPEGYDTQTYLRWLQTKSRFQEFCLFATAPDVVGDPFETWQRAEPVLPLISGAGYRAALVAQDGVEDTPIAWDTFDAWFVGGTTKWKLSSASYALIAEARERGKWVHMGRVNSWRRLKAAAIAGCHSVDGTKAIYAPDQNVPRIISWVDALRDAPPMALYSPGTTGCKL